MIFVLKFLIAILRHLLHSIEGLSNIYNPWKTNLSM